MTRLRTEDIEHIPQELEEYDRRLSAKTGKTLKGIGFYAVGLRDDEFEEIVGKSKVCVVPLSCGQGIIKGFSESVSSIISHLGFHSFGARNSDGAGIAEAFERQADIIFLADDYRFVAINVHTRRVSDNNEMTARGFVAGLDLMANGLKGDTALVIGCGQVGSHAARILVGMGVAVSVCDINAQLASTLQKKIKDELKADIEIDDRRHLTSGKYRYIIGATASADFIDASMVTPEACVAVPGVPCGLSSEARRKVSNRYLHDPLQIGVAAMAIDACKR
ncbi:MAG: 3-methylornithyl-N6-L-lysine dehydrogenase PylD [Planctomycetota bacterium]|jgi:pyrrolysine biosynthesis protein PylD